uniref:NADH-ubiquinone oxidoreductase chain 5 n=1 Tax=Strongylogaster xanthocera TaxID=1385064 RepID=A0A7T8G4G7_9HYME|nr:NADH dehydrogenase subunit 5 [Strongylogaster xanthocera]
MFMDLCINMMFILIIFSLMMIYLGVYFFMFNLKYFFEFMIMSMNSSSIVMTLYFDWMTFMFLGVVLLISSSVIYYSKFYMLGDLNLNRFIFLVLMFVFSMMLLVISPNLISILLGWDGLGLVSYCLVIYYQNVSSFNAGMVTVLSNRIGDVFLLMSIAWMMIFGSWNYIFYMDFMMMNIEMSYIMLFIVVSSFTKSAQIPFSSWLPAAMAAPTPVSSLVHSSTLVTAGVYLLIRFENLVKNNVYINLFLMFSILTMFMSGLNANFENDLKKIIALSTLSQLGLMLSILFLGYGLLSFFHMLMHALFKALLFMCAGMYIHNFSSFQDIRYMGSISMQMPFVSICFMVANLALCGFPFLAGFYSKDLILETIMMMNFNLIVIFLFFLSTLLTVSYTFRLIYFSMIMNLNFFSLNFLNDMNWKMNKSLLGLMMMVIFGGSMLSWMIFPYPLMICLPLILKIFPLILIFMGSLLGYIFFCLDYKKKIIKNYFLKMFFTLMWFLPIISMKSFVKYFLMYSMNLYMIMDQSWTEYILGRNLIYFIYKNSSFLDLMMFYLNKLMYLFLIMILFIWYIYMINM